MLLSPFINNVYCLYICGTIVYNNTFPVFIGLKKNGFEAFL